MAKKKAPKQPRRIQRMPRSLGPLDAGGKKWAALLNDPCTAELVPGCYPSGEGGLLQRVESDLLIFTNPATTSGVVCYTPGVLGDGSAIFNGGLVTGESATDGAALSFVSQAGYQPGNTQATSNWGQYRCVAACLQVSWPGSELNRQGLVALGNMSAQVVVNNGSTGQTRTTLQNVTRMPEDMAEIKWRPGAMDNQFSPYYVGAGGPGQEILQGRSSIVLAVTGLPATVGIRIRMVAVYEVIPRITTGIVVASQNRSHSRNTVNEVLDYLDGLGNWAFKVGHTVERGFNTALNLYKTASAFGRFGSAASGALALMA